MPLKTCSECGKQISSSAKSCPHCGKHFTSAAKALAALVIVGFAFLMIIAMANVRPTTPTPTESPVETRLGQARPASDISLKRHLNDPDSAQLDWATWPAQERKNGTVLVKITGRAKNAFGAYMLATWRCEAKVKGSNVRVLSLQQMTP